jgi:hypothetical protein
MRSFIDIINETDTHGVAESIYRNMSPIARMRLRDKVTGINAKNGAPYVRGDELSMQAVEYIAANMDEFAKKAEPVARDLEDGGIHRLY